MTQHGRPVRATANRRQAETACDITTIYRNEGHEMKKSHRINKMGIMAAITAALLLTVGIAVFAAPPPYGILLDNEWAYESESEGVAYSFSPVPAYRADDANGPDLLLAQGTSFNFFYDLDVTICKINKWNAHGAGHHDIEFSGSYETTGDGVYSFNSPGMYWIQFEMGPILHVEVSGSTAPITAAAPQAGEVSVVLNGKALSFDVPPQIINGRTLVPLRVIFESLGATVDWNGATQTVTAIKGGTTVSLTIGSNILTKNGVGVELDVPAQLINDRTLVPARAVAEAFGATVGWIDATQTVTINLT